MKIRIMGTSEELTAAEEYYKALRNEPYVNYVEISRRYPNRNDSTLSRIYVEVACWKDCPSDTLMLRGNYGKDTTR